MRPGTLEPGTAALVRVSAALATRDPERIDEALALARGAIESTAVEETLLQSYLFLGYPAALDAIGRWRALGAAPPPTAAPEDWASWAMRGEEVCERVYGAQYARLRDNVRELHPDLERWMVVEGYGKVLGRRGLSLDARELCIAALLAVLDAPRQLYSHLRGAVNVGATSAGVAAALAIAEEYMAEETRGRAYAVWADVRTRTSGKAGQEGLDAPQRGGGA